MYAIGIIYVYCIYFYIHITCKVNKLSPQDMTSVEAAAQRVGGPRIDHPTRWMWILGSENSGVNHRNYNMQQHYVQQGRGWFSHVLICVNRLILITLATRNGNLAKDWKCGIADSPQLWQRFSGKLMISLSYSLHFGRHCWFSEWLEFQGLKHSSPRIWKRFLDCPMTAMLM